MEHYCCLMCLAWILAHKVRECLGFSLPKALRRGHRWPENNHVPFEIVAIADELGVALVRTNGAVRHFEETDSYPGLGEIDEAHFLQGH